MNNIEAKSEDESEVKDLVIKDNNARQKSKAKDTTEITKEDMPTQLC